MMTIDGDSLLQQFDAATAHKELQKISQKELRKKKKSAAFILVQGVVKKPAAD